MGEAKRKRALINRPAPVKVRARKLLIPVELDDRLQALATPKVLYDQWLVGALAAFAGLAEQEKERLEFKDRLVIPATHVPKLPSGSLLGGRK